MKSKKLGNDSLLQAAKEKIKFRKYRKWYYSAFVSLAAIVVFCTVYALILPAITMTTKEGNTAARTDTNNREHFGLAGFGYLSCQRAGGRKVGRL